MPRVNLSLSYSDEDLNLVHEDGIELPSFASAILLQMLSISIHRTLNLNLADPQTHLRAAEEKGRREALLQFASYFKNPELPK